MPPTPLLVAHAADLTAAHTAGGAMPDGFEGPACNPLIAGTEPKVLSLDNHANCAGVLKEDGLTRYATAVYNRTGGGEVTAYAMEFGDATGAYSAYTLLRSQMRDARVTDGDAHSGKAHETSSNGVDTLVWAGTAVLRLGRPVNAAELSALVAALPKVGGRAGLAPLLPTLQPEDGRAKGSERYAIGPVGYAAMGGQLPAELLGWSKSAEVLTARYGGKGGDGTVTLMLYPTPQIAGDRGRAVESWVNAQGPDKFGTVKMRRLGPLVGMTMGGFGGQHAKDLMDALRLNQEVSFDKPMPLEFHAEMQKTYSLMQSIALFCGLGLVAALLLGAFLGGARAGIRLLQGKSAASEPEFLTINLRGEAKGVLLPEERKR